MVEHIQAIILAGGKSTRFGTGNTKLTEKICGLEMILYPTQLLETLHIPTTILVGHQKEVIEELICKRYQNTKFVVQQEQKGTGHALLCTKDTWQQPAILVINGDIPLLKEETLATLITSHRQTNAAVTLLAAHNADPSLHGYGRIIQDNNTIHIAEAKDFVGDVAKYCCVNAGVYIFSQQFLQQHVTALTANNKAQEFYITDLIGRASQQGLQVTVVNTKFDEIRGVNTYQELWTAEQIKRAELIAHWMRKGVRFHAAQATHLDYNVTIGTGCQIGAAVLITEGSTIGNNCIIESLSLIKNAKIADNVVIHANSVIHDSTIESGCTIGPFAHIESNSSVDQHSMIGNFVQIKRSSIGKNTKVKHLAFLGDAIVGSNTNIGAGTITCNYDGAKKNPTIIQDNCFIGSNNTLIAPLVIGSNSFTAAGSVITNDVPQDGFAIARMHQTTKEHYAKKIRKKMADDKDTPIPVCKKPISSIQNP